MSDFLKRAGEYYAYDLMRGYTYPMNSPQTQEIEQFLSRMPNSQDYDAIENFYLHRQPPFNRHQIRAIAHYAQDFACRFRNEFYYSPVKQNAL